MTRGIACVVVLLCLVSDSQGGEYFIDDFEDGNAEDGNPVTWVPQVPPLHRGVREVVNGDYVITPTSAPGDYYFQSDSVVLGTVHDGVTIRTQARALDSAVDLESYYLGVFARDTDGSSGVWAAIADNGRLTIGAFNTALYEENLWSIESTLDPTQTDVRLKFDVFEDAAALTAWAAGTNRPDAQLLVTLPAYVADEGRIGAWVGNVSDSSHRIPGAFRWYAAGPGLYNADFDLDADVDGDDFLLWQVGFGTQRGATPGDGDADGDGDTDGDDFLIWQREFGIGVGALAVASVPEPPSAILFSALFALAAYTKLKSRELGRHG
jgi:hypothetical protein